MPPRRPKRGLEVAWLPELLRHLGLPRDRLPLLWDCDFMFGERRPDDHERYVLCEINVSSVAPFRDSAVESLVSATIEYASTRRPVRE